MNDIMDMKISGSSAMPGGEYRTVSISGSGKVQGSLRCESLRCSGSARVQGDVDCAGEIRCSGSSRVTGDIACQELGCSGSTRCEGNLRANGRVHSSGALKVGADFLKRYFPDSAVWVSDPTWENHVAIFAGAGFEVHTYPWFDRATRGVNFPAMLAALQQLPPRSIVLLHPCCHNPTGADLTPEQWDRVIEVVIVRELIPFLDIAYQGFGRGLDEDAYAIRAIASAGLTALVSNSFSKIFSLYGERVGGLSVVCDNADAAGRVLGQLKATVRRNYSSPPSFGAQVVATVLNDAGLKATWQAEVDAMRAHILTMRQALVDALQQVAPGSKVDYLLKQRGMFSYSGFSAAQVDRLRDEFGVYLIASGRMCVAGLNSRNVQQVAKAFAAVM